MHDDGLIPENNNQSQFNTCPMFLKKNAGNNKTTITEAQLEHKSIDYNDLCSHISEQKLLTFQGSRES